MSPGSSYAQRTQLTGAYLGACCLVYNNGHSSTMTDKAHWTNTEKLDRHVLMFLRPYSSCLMQQATADQFYFVIDTAAMVDTAAT